MNDIKKTIVSGALAALLGFTGASVAMAEETSAGVDAEFTAEVAATSSLPLIRLRQEAREKIENLRENMKDQRLEIRVQMRNATTSEEREDIIENAREDRDEARERVSEVRATLKTRVEALVKTHVGAIFKRSEGAISMFDNIVDRMESRIEKLQKSGAETATVEASLNASVERIDAAKVDLRALEALVDSIRDTSDPETVRVQLRAAISDLTASVKAAHASLLETARLLASISASASVESSGEIDTN